MVTNKNRLSSTPANNPQQGWIEAFNAAATDDCDIAPFLKVANDFDESDWIS